MTISDEIEACPHHHIDNDSRCQDCGFQFCQSGDTWYSAVWGQVQEPCHRPATDQYEDLHLCEVHMDRIRRKFYA